MKKIFLIALALVFVASGVAIAAETNKELTFGWSDDNAKTDGYHWALFMRGDGEAVRFI